MRNKFITKVSLVLSFVTIIGFGQVTQAAQAATIKYNRYYPI
ncbi:hypothetical protein CSC2_28070 [Clostridium zeae]|uniref:Uncharacterized protein n=1 Tax=Clostridium zeae TaxID=2759022 RepID=A0ABQ1EBW3_9CLOT|nr:hypothetical protein [Clostridium zeae]GFZ32281.1 hypothetical protein CSC2_28070 [Clostridium zeae]